MTTPGVLTKSGVDLAASSPAVVMGTWFIGGVTEKGPANAPKLIKSLSEYKATYGARVAYGYLYDSVQTYFEEARPFGGRIYVGRIVGPEAATATISLSDGSSNTLKVTASSPGEWGNALSVVTTHPGSGTFKFVIKLGATVVQESETFETNADAVAWAKNSGYIRLEDLGNGDPAEATKTLAGGKDDHAAITGANRRTALALFSPDLGPGQMSLPGYTAAEAQEDVLAACEETNRVAILDGQDTSVVGTLTSQALTLRGTSTARYGGLFAPWAVIPGISPGTTRTVPYSAVEAGIIARNDASGLNPNEPSSGDNGVSRYALGLSQPAWNYVQRGELNDAGVNVARVMLGAVRTYGYRTLVNWVLDETWIGLANARLDSFIKSKSEAIGERFKDKSIGKKLPAKFGSAIAGEVLLPLWNEEALFGDTETEAFVVDTGDAVNTEESISERKLRALAKVKMSEFSELVEIEIEKEAI